MTIQFGMPYGFQQALDRKYSILGQEADARTLTAKADANLTNVRAAVLPDESAANIGLTKAQTSLAGANTKNVEETTKFVAPLAKASIFNTKAQGSLFGQQAIGEYQLNKLSRTLAGKGGAAGSGASAFGDDFDASLKAILEKSLYGN